MEGQDGKESQEVQFIKFNECLLKKTAVPAAQMTTTEMLIPAESCANMKAGPREEMYGSHHPFAELFWGRPAKNWVKRNTTPFAARALT
jgi:hypothetical protein